MKYSASCLFLLVAFCLAVSCAPAAPPEPTDADRLPEGWDPSALEALIGKLDLIKTVENEIDIRVLRWKVEENDRSQRIESALVWALFRAGTAEDWMLAHVIRAGAVGEEPSPWALAVWKGTPQVSHEHYEHAPSASDVNRFMRATWWSDEPTAGNRLVDAAVRTPTWTSVIGEPPPGNGG